MKIEIGNINIGENEPTYIIVEIARTYGNNITKAKKMIRMASECGADAVKIQSIDAKGLMVYNNNTKEYYKKLEKLERSFEEHKSLADCCKKYGIEFLSTPESFDMADLLEEIGVKAYKISSLDMVYYDFLEYIAKKQKPIILSTGMATEEEIKKAIKVIKKEGNNKIILMHCVSLYPPKIEELNLNMINLIKNKFKVIPGFSDHTSDIKASLCAMALGTKVIEKHFKIDYGKNSFWKGDYNVSITPKQLKELVEYRDMLTKKSQTKVLSKRELEKRAIKGRKIVTTKDIKKGTKLTNDLLECKQNLSKQGIDCSLLEEVIGKKLNKYKRKGEILNSKDV